MGVGIRSSVVSKSPQALWMEMSMNHSESDDAKLPKHYSTPVCMSTREKLGGWEVPASHHDGGAGVGAVNTHAGQKVERKESALLGREP